MKLKELRKSKKITQEQAAHLCGVSVRSYKTYENEPDKENTIKYSYFIRTLSGYHVIDEEHGILTVAEITDISSEIFARYNISFCYLFGSYAKGKALETSDVDLLIGSSLTGIRFYGLVEELRQKLGKRVDALSVEQLNNNLELINEILRDGVKIYGKSQE